MNLANIIHFPFTRVCIADHIAVNHRSPAQHNDLFADIYRWSSRFHGDVAYKLRKITTALNCLFAFHKLMIKSQYRGYDDP